MLDELAVRNLAVLEEARLQPGPGLTVVTGETGTGKTLLLGALGILTGDDFRPDRIGPFSDEATIEARFVEPNGEELIVARKLERGGRTRSYVNGSMAAAAELGERLSGSIEIVAQHDHLRVARPAEILRILDGLLDEPGRSAYEEYRALWSEWTLLARRAEHLGGDQRALERERDLHAHEAREIAAARFSDAEVDDLRASVSRLRHAQDLLELLGRAVALLEEAADSVGIALTATRRASELSDGLAALSSRVEGLSIELRDAAGETAGELAETALDPEELERVEQRLASFGDLRRRYGDTAAEINTYGERAAARAIELAETLSLAGHLEVERARLRLALDSVGAQVAGARRKAAEALRESTELHLRDLGFTMPLVDVAFEDLPEPTARGTVAATLLFASDSSLTPGPVSRVASGGELSRLVLALRLASGIGDVDVVAFDEIDAGVGGSTALRLGEKLAALASHHQVLCVTHLPQIAAFADTHYTIDRVAGSARARRVEGQARLAELTRMLSGIESTDSGLSHAEELVDYADRHRA